MAYQHIYRHYDARRDIEITTDFDDGDPPVVIREGANTVTLHESELVRAMEMFSKAKADHMPF